MPHQLYSLSVVICAIIISHVPNIIEGNYDKMSGIVQLWHNTILINGLFAWAFAQVSKALIYASINKKFEVTRLIGDGGMPSGHSATVTAMAITSAIQFGLSSFQFAVTSILALIVMHDAMGVRLETGKQAKVINEMIGFFQSMGKENSSEEKLKEFVGHTPAQVVVGSMIGFLVALVFR